MTEQLTAQEQKTIVAMTYFVLSKLKANIPDDQVVNDLVELSGMPRDFAEEFLSSVKANRLSLEKQYNKFENKIINCEIGKKKMRRGFIFLVIGGLITGVTYIFAFTSGGSYIITTGAFLVAGYYLLTGFIGWLFNK